MRNFISRNGAKPYSMPRPHSADFLEFEPPKAGENGNFSNLNID